MVQYGQSTSIVRTFLLLRHGNIDLDQCPAAQSRFLVSGSADNELRLWNVSDGKCLYVWEFPTAVKRVAFSDDDERVVCITEQRMGHQCVIRVFKLNRDGDGTARE
jgi:translation initiation factor 3 subunit I